MSDPQREAERSVPGNPRRSAPQRVRGALGCLAGVAAVALAVGAGELSAAVISPSSSPIAVIGGALIDLAPPWAKDLAIAWFGTADKVALLAGIAVVMLALAALAGWVEARRPPWGRVIVGAFGLAGAVIAMTRADAGALSWLPAAVAGAVGVIALGLLIRMLRPTAAAGSAPATSATPATPGATAPATPATPATPDATAPATPAVPATPATPDATAPAVPATPATPDAATPAVPATPATPDATAPAVPATPASPDATAPAVPATPAVPAVPAAPASPASPAEPSRRAFFAWSGAAIAAGVLAVAITNVRRAGGAAVTAIRDALRLPAPAVAASAVPSGAELDIPGLARVITPNDSFYRIDTALIVPEIDPADWSLRIHGLVENEIVITWDELLALPLEESYTTLACVSNEVGGSLFGNAKWLGYPIRELLARARPTIDADMVLSRSIDGFTASTPLDVLTDDRDAVLAVGMNDEPLPLEHGFPVRMVVPGLYGYVSATKWVTELKVTRFDADQAYWSTRGWSERGPIKLQSRIDVPRRGQGLKAGDVVIAGVAWHQHVGVSGVEVQVDEGEWMPATLATAISDDTWVQWSLPWTATEGDHLIRCRAISADGEVQTSDRAAVAPDGATGWHERYVEVFA